MGRDFFKIEKTFIRPIALSTCIQALAIFLVTIALSLDICSSPELGGGISNVVPLTMRSSFIVKPLSAIIKSVGSRRSRNPDSQVMCWSDALPLHVFERKLIIPLGAIPTRNLTVLCFLYIVRPSESLNFKISRTVHKYLTAVYCATQVWVMSKELKETFSNCLL